MMAMLMVTSCDKDADNKKMEMVSGMYKGNVESYLYVPDYFTELENVIYYTSNLSPALAGDTDTKADVNFSFTSDNMAVVSINNLTGIHFEVQFLAKNEEGKLAIDDDGKYIVRPSFANGSLAELLSIVDQCVSVDEYNNFAKNYMGVLVDDLQFENIKTSPLLMVENGAVYSSYDFEQHSFYERFSMEPITFKRQGSLTAAAEQLQLLMAAHPAEFEPYKGRISQIFDSYKTEGVIRDASGWCSLTYANYHPRVVFSFTKATGLIDVLSAALFGKNEDKDKMKTLWMMMYYEGTIGDLSSYERISDD